MTILAVRAARSDASIARVLPVFLWMHGALVGEALIERAKHAGIERFVGFFLDLTAEVSGVDSFTRLADRLRAGCGSRDVYFFKGTGRSAVAREIAEMRAPAVARKWHLFMNMPLDSFTTMFWKVTTGRQVHPLRKGKLPELLRPLFWQYRFEELRVENNVELVMLHVLTYGRPDQIDWLRGRFGDDGIRRWIIGRRGRGLTRKQMSRWVSWRTATRWQRSDANARIWEYR